MDLLRKILESVPNYIILWIISAFFKAISFSLGIIPLIAALLQQPRFWRSRYATRSELFVKALFKEIPPPQTIRFHYPTHAQV